MQEFNQYTQKKERVTSDKPGEASLQQSDHFAEHLLVSTLNSGLKNLTSKSVILAPFNSTVSDENMIRQTRRQIEQLILPRMVIKFNPKLKEINRQYELNNNAEVDNGVYHADEDFDSDSVDQSISINGKDAGFASVNGEIKNLATSFGQQQLES